MSTLESYYAARASEYDRIYAKPERQPDLDKLRQRIPACFAARDVLEIACGTGYWTQLIAPVARSVCALDINEETLAIARARMAPSPRVRFEIADVKALAGYRDFGGAFAGFWWSHLKRDERAAFIRSLHGALRKGALVVLLDNRYVEGSSTPIFHVDGDGNTYQRRRLDDGSEHVVLKNFPTRDELASDIGEHGSALAYTAYDYYWLLEYKVA